MKWWCKQRGGFWGEVDFAKQRPCSFIIKSYISLIVFWDRDTTASTLYIFTWPLGISSLVNGYQHPHTTQCHCMMGITWMRNQLWVVHDWWLGFRYKKNIDLFQGWWCFVIWNPWGCLALLYSDPSSKWATSTDNDKSCTFIWVVQMTFNWIQLNEIKEKKLRVFPRDTSNSYMFFLN